MNSNKVSRRNFLQVTALTVGALSAGTHAIGQTRSSSVALVADPIEPWFIVNVADKKTGNAANFIEGLFG